MLSMASEEFRKPCFKATMSHTRAMEVGEVTFVDFTLRADFGLVVGGQETWVLRAGSGCNWCNRGIFCTEYY